MKIKISMFGKMILLSGFIEVIMMIIVLFALYAFHLNDRKQGFVSMENILLECSSLRLEMLVMRDSNFSILYERNNNKIFEKLSKYDSVSSKLTKSENVLLLDSLKKSYQNFVSSYALLIKEFGLNENEGIEGNFRAKIHSIEEFLKKTKNDKVYLLMLQARRREKDYIMRGRQEYIDQVFQLMNKLTSEVRSSNDLSEFEKSQILVLAKGYSDSFSEFVSIKQRMLEKEKNMQVIENRLKEIIAEIVAVESENAESYQATLIPLFILSILISFIMSILIAKSITKPLVKLKLATIKIAKGDFRIKVKVESEDEIGDLARFFNNMTENIRIANETILNQQDKLNVQFTELKAINATRDKFFSIIAHDLRNPISAFMGVSDFLVTTFQELTLDEIKEFLDDVNSSAKSLYELLENLLLWSRSQRGLINYHPNKLDLKGIVENNLDLLKFNADNKKITLDYEMEKEFKIYADPNMINTVLRNLITNAIKFTHENGLVRVKCISEGDYCRISVCDNGVGMSEEHSKSLFQLEGNVSTVGTHQESGTGLGLILCREFVERHTGRIWVESKIGEGSKFHFTIPIAKRNNPNEETD